ncbi:hypothetical protein FRC01_003456, partial [Tulasnella sp. 417]
MPVLTHHPYFTLILLRIVVHGDYAVEFVIPRLPTLPPLALPLCVRVDRPGRGWPSTSSNSSSTATAPAGFATARARWPPYASLNRTAPLPPSSGPAAYRIGTAFGSRAADFDFNS